MISVSIGVGGEHYHPHLWELSLEGLGRLDAIHPRHAHVHQHHVRVQRLGRFYPLTPIGRLAQDAASRVVSPCIWA